MSSLLEINSGPLALGEVFDFVLKPKSFHGIRISDECRARVERSHAHMCALLEKHVPIYGVSTGFGDSLNRFIPAAQSEILQKNLISYLLCGVGEKLPRQASRAISLFRLHSLCRGYSGVSWQLIEQLKTFVENDWLPVIPAQGSLGASGDLIPLAYLGEILQGEGKVDTPRGIMPTAQLLSETGVRPYRLKPKEGLALVNGTSAMAGLTLLNLAEIDQVLELSTVGTAWLCLALQGRTEAFGPLVNEKAKAHNGQAIIAREILEMLNDEGYSPVPLSSIQVEGNKTVGFIQDRYSLRCTPQVLGPVRDTLSMVEKWLVDEINSVSDNPLFDEDGSMAMGGNFYGGYLSHGMDYLKICLGHVADLVDRQLMTVIDEKSSRGLPPNLANWNGMTSEERHLHHGLKGLHQAVNAITSEVMAKTMPNGIFSRSSESHNQDKVSLGMSAAVQCSQIFPSMYSIMAMHLTCLAQALDLRGVRLKGERSRLLYEKVRRQIPFIERDCALGERIESLAQSLRYSKEEARL
jgi:histidine ammonia-lyase